MKKIKKILIFCFLFVLFFSFNISSLKADINFEFAKNIGGTGNDRGYSMVKDDDNNIYITGYFSGTVDFDPGVGTVNLTSAGETDIFILKLDLNGDFVWAKKVGGTLGDYGVDITLDSQDNIYITGYFNGTADFDPGVGISSLTSAGDTDIFILKLNSNGGYVLAKRFGSTGPDRGNSISVSNIDYSIYTTGYFSETVDFNPGGGFNLISSGGRDVFISKLREDGSFFWAKKVGGTGDDIGVSINLDAPNNIYLTGEFSDTVDFDSGAGTSNLTSNGGFDVFALVLDPAGSFWYAKQIGGTGGDYVYDTLIDSESNIYI